MSSLEFGWEEVVSSFSFADGVLSLKIGFPEFSDEHRLELKGDELQAALFLFEAIYDKKLTAGKCRFDNYKCGKFVEIQPHAGSCAGSTIVTLGDPWHELFTLVEREQLLELIKLCSGAKDEA